MKNATAVGNKAETLACEYLVDRGYKVVERNYKDRFCEIDIVATNKEFVVFVEVKYRASTNYGGPVSAVTPAKLKRMRNSAEYWLATHTDFQAHQPRLDVITLVGDLSLAKVEHIQNCE